MVLNAADPHQVASASSFEVAMGEPAAKVVFFSGIGLVDWSVDNDGPGDADITRNLMIVRLWPGRQVREILGWTATVGLASVGSTDDDWMTATDTVSVYTGPDDGELLLSSQLYASGDDAYLGRVAYSATVLLETDEPYISG